MRKYLWAALCVFATCAAYADTFDVSVNYNGTTRVYISGYDSTGYYTYNGGVYGQEGWDFGYFGRSYPTVLRVFDRSGIADEICCNPYEVESKGFDANVCEGIAQTEEYIIFDSIGSDTFGSVQSAMDSGSPDFYICTPQGWTGAQQGEGCRQENLYTLFDRCGSIIVHLDSNYIQSCDFSTCGCEVGFYGPRGLTNCRRCSDATGNPAATSRINENYDISGCYLPPGVSGSDASGSYTIVSDCYYN